MSIKHLLLLWGERSQGRGGEAQEGEPPSVGSGSGRSERWGLQEGSEGEASGRTSMRAGRRERRTPDVACAGSEREKPGRADPI
jgi:hypothetical protein